MTIALCSSPVQAGDPAKAEELFRSALKLFHSGQYEQACPKFAESYQLDPTFAALFNLAACHMKQGKWASALHEFRQAAALAQSSEMLEENQNATQQAEQLTKRVSTLKLEWVERPPYARVLHNGIQVAPTHFDARTPLDPGVHQLQVTAPNHETYTLKVTVGTNAEQHTLVIPKLAIIAQEESKPTPLTPNPIATPKLATHTPLPSSESTPSSWLRYTLLGAGGAVLVTGVIFTIVGFEKNAELKDLCNGNVSQCSSSDARTPKLEKQRDLYDTLGFIGMVAGGVSVATGFALPWLSPRPKIHSEAQRHIAPTHQLRAQLEPWLLGARLHGEF